MKTRLIASILLAGLLLLDAATADARGPHVFFDIGIPVWGPWWSPPYPYPYPVPPPVIVQQAPVVQTPPPAPTYWYYCPNPQGYYPYVQQCLAGWLKVVPPAAPPGQSTGPVGASPGP